MVSLANQKRYDVGSGPQAVVVADFDNDHRLDIVVASSGSNDVSVLLGYGNGSFADAVSYDVGSVPQAVAVGDFDGDKRLGHRCGQF